MPKNYEEYSGENLNREVLDSLKIGNKILFDDSKFTMRVYGVSENYVLTGRCSFDGNFIYSIIRKEMWAGQYGAMNKNTFIHGPDNKVHGYLHPHAYELDNPDFVRDYLDDLERGRIEMSAKSSRSFYKLSVKRC